MKEARLKQPRTCNPRATNSVQSGTTVSNVPERTRHWPSLSTCVVSSTATAAGSDSVSTKAEITCKPPHQQLCVGHKHGKRASVDTFLTSS